MTGGISGTGVTDGDGRLVGNIEGAAFVGGSVSTRVGSFCGPDTGLENSPGGVSVLQATSNVRRITIRKKAFLFLTIYTPPLFRPSSIPVSAATTPMESRHLKYPWFKLKRMRRG